MTVRRHNALVLTLVLAVDLDTGKLGLFHGATAPGVAPVRRIRTGELTEHRRRAIRDHVAQLIDELVDEGVRRMTTH